MPTPASKSTPTPSSKPATTPTSKPATTPTSKPATTPASKPTTTPPRRRGLGRAPWLLALAVLVILGALAGVGWLAMDRSGGEQTFEGGGVRMSLPEDWTLEDTSGNQACQTEGLECVAILSAPQGYNFSVTWYQQSGPVSVQTVDDLEWKRFVAYYPSAILFERSDLQVGGQPAIQRTFMQNDSQGTPIYFRQIYAVKELRLYLITARFFSADEMEAQAAVVDAVIASIHFTGE